MTSRLEGMGDIGDFRSGDRIVAPRFPLIVPGKAALKLYTLSPNSDRFGEDYLRRVKEKVQGKLGEDIPLGIGMGFIILSENEVSPRGYLSVTMWHRDLDSSSPPKSKDRLYIFESGNFPENLRAGGSGYCMYEAQIAGFEAAAIQEYASDPDAAGEKWLERLCRGKLPFFRPSR